MICNNNPQFPELRPIESEKRELRDLSGIWRFGFCPDGIMPVEWITTGPIPSQAIPVPSSYNDLFTDSSCRDHLGEVCYAREFFVPPTWSGRRIYLRFGSATHRARVWLNGKLVATHEGGYLPFEADLAPVVRFDSKNTVVVAVDNTLHPTTIPPGEIKTEVYGWGEIRHQEIYHDFFNYSGLHRPVLLCSTPRDRITDFTFSTLSLSLSNSSAVVSLTIATVGKGTVSFRLISPFGYCVARGAGPATELKIHQPSPWSPDHPHLYELEITLSSPAGDILDIYRARVGLRTVAVEANRLLLNGRPFYFRGCGKHEDSECRGKGHDDAVNIRDFNLLKWIGANSTRTAHYPYSDEFMDLADASGLALIDETAAVGLQYFGKSTPFFTPDRVPELFDTHIAHLRELVHRDKNRPSVLLWSVANEAGTNEPASRDYFQRIVAETRRLDPTRPITNVLCTSPDTEQTADLFDVLCLNRYHGWYWHPGRREMIRPSMIAELTAWYDRFGKPIILSEFGADTLDGLHTLPAAVFSEEWQIEYLAENCAALDALPFIIGEHVWNFADFATKQAINRAGGNRKGVFTRQRQPKLAAHFLRRRWSSADPETHRPGANSCHEL